MLTVEGVTRDTSVISSGSLFTVAADLTLGVEVKVNVNVDVGIEAGANDGTKDASLELGKPHCTSATQVAT